MWLEALKTACEASSQAQVARRLGVSTAMVSQALNGVYKGNIQRLQGLVEGELMSLAVDCPVIGAEIPRQRCVEHQNQPFRMTSPMRIALWKGCKSCPNKIVNGGKDE
jgi:hypothetical protein